MTITKKSVGELQQVIRALYLSDSLPWVIGYSGGKDSTATLQLVWSSLAELNSDQLQKPVHIINTNTLVESPIVMKWVDNSLNLMGKRIQEQNLPFYVHQLTPEPEDSFWVNFLGKGYPAPRRSMRWCTDRLKIQPVNTFIKQKIAEHGEIIMVLGTRKAESTNRARAMNSLEKQRVRELLSPNPTLRNEYVFSPLENWSDDDVWIYLMQYKNPWGLPNSSLLTLYKGATEDGECPIMQDKSAPSCGNSRFGCWVCTVVSKDKSLAAMINNDPEKEWLRPMTELRNQFDGTGADRDKRSFRKMNGSLQGGHGQLYHGPYLKKVREDWLRQLLIIQSDFKKNAPDDFKDTTLISQEELKLIRRIWVLEKHEFDDSLPRIYQEATGEPFMDPDWIYDDSFGLEEWNLLKECCDKYDSNEELLFELLYSILDLEKKAEKTGNRRQLIENLKTVISRTFYRNEEDALEYYTNTNILLRDHGLKYREVLFDKNGFQDDLPDSEYEEGEE